MSYDAGEARRLLGNATARHLYYFGEQREADGSLSWGHHPACAAGILRERHVADPPTDPVTGAVEDSPLQTAFEYSDGGGAALVKKAQAEPAPGATALRWIATGKIVLNNKGKPVKQYEPYFSPSEHRFEEPVEVGVTPLLYYDAAGRLVRTEMPDGTFSRVELSPWHVLSFDANDTVLESGWYAERNPPDPSQPLPVDGLTGQPAATPDQRAAWLAAQHAGTPALTALDSLGRDVIGITHNRYTDTGGTLRDEKYLTFTKLDAEGKPLWIRDARGNLVMQYLVQPPAAPPQPVSNTVEPTTYTPAYDIAGNLLFQHSMDAGDRWTLNDAAGKPMFAWDFNQRQDPGAAAADERRRYSTLYDELHRPTALWLEGNGGPAALVEAFRYGEGVAGDRVLNLRGHLHEHHDQSGLVTLVSCDFAGRTRELHRTLASEYQAPRIDWQASSVTARLETETFIQITTYDALGRMRRLDDWHRAGGKVAKYEPRYNARGLLASEDLTIGATTTKVIEAIAYDAKGQREAIHYGNETRTRFRYDAETFRLVQLRTTRPGYVPAFPSAVNVLKNVNVVQNLYYAYDAVGNITEVHDDAYEPAFFDNQEVEPQARYTYDALYRLIAATGREGFDSNKAPGRPEDLPLEVTFPLGSNPKALRTYNQRYFYDAAGNISEMRHWAGAERWRRNYEYAPDSNRLAYTWLGTGTRVNTPGATEHEHDVHGNMLNLANVGVADHLRWDHRDMIQVFERGGGGQVNYQYDAGKQRTRKVAENGAKSWERIYLGGVEIYRRYVGGGVVEEIESHHVFEGGHRVLLVEDVLKTNRAGATTGALYRYQYGNHLGSACLELDAQANVISYEEYHPYGTSAYRTARSQAEAPKRYRYTGMERDEESGLDYRTARYYAPWMARWVSSDPSGLVDGANVYTYVRANPINFIDRTGAATSTPSQKVMPIFAGPVQPPISMQAKSYTHTGELLDAYFEGVNLSLEAMLSFGGTAVKWIGWDMWGSAMYDLTGASAYKDQHDASKAVVQSTMAFLKAGPSGAVAALMAPLDEFNAAIERGDEIAAAKSLGAWVPNVLMTIDMMAPRKGGLAERPVAKKRLLEKEKAEAKWDRQQKMSMWRELKEAELGDLLIELTGSARKNSGLLEVMKDKILETLKPNEERLSRTGEKKPADVVIAKEMTDLEVLQELQRLADSGDPVAANLLEGLGVKDIATKLDKVTELEAQLARDLVVNPPQPPPTD